MIIERIDHFQSRAVYFFLFFALTRIETICRTIETILKQILTIGFLLSESSRKHRPVHTYIIHETPEQVKGIPTFFSKPQ